jgi:hypothetical protein
MTEITALVAEYLATLEHTVILSIHKCRVTGLEPLCTSDNWFKCFSKEKEELVSLSAFQMK